MIKTRYYKVQTKPRVSSSNIYSQVHGEHAPNKAWPSTEKAVIIRIAEKVTIVRLSSKEKALFHYVILLILNINDLGVV